MSSPTSEVLLIAQTVEGDLQELKDDPSDENVLILYESWKSLIEALVHVGGAIYTDEQSMKTYALAFGTEEKHGLTDKDVLDGDLLDLVGIIAQGQTFLFSTIRENNMNLIIDLGFIVRFIDALRNGYIVDQVTVNA